MIERLSTNYRSLPFVHAFAKINEIIDALNPVIDPTGRPRSAEPSSGSEMGQSDPDDTGTPRVGLEPTTTRLTGDRPFGSVGHVRPKGPIGGGEGAQVNTDSAGLPEAGGSKMGQAARMVPAPEAAWRARMACMLADPDENCPGPTYLAMALRIRELEAGR